MQRTFTWPGPLADMDPSQRNLTLAVAVSLLIHAIVLSIHFKLPEALGRATEHALDVILVNSKSAHRPADAQAKAQTNLDGGGNTDAERRIKTPLPVAKSQRDGDAVVEAQRRVAELEAQQQQMLTRIKSGKAVAADRSASAPPAPAPRASGMDLASSAMKLIRYEGQIDRNIDEYNKRPHKEIFRPRVSEYRFAQYVEDWRNKVERFGNLNYPESARGRLYGTLMLTVEINADGSLRSVVIDRPSAHKILNEAARRIVEIAAPYAVFPPDVARDTDVISITRTWTFTNADRLHAE